MIEKNIEDTYLDLDKIFEFINEGHSDNEKEKEIQEGYEMERGKPMLKSRVVREVENEAHGTDQNLKYDFIKYLLDNLFEDNNAFTKAIIMTTFEKYNFITNINPNE